MADITLKGNPFHTSGDLPAVGSAAPNFRLVNGEMADRTLDDYKGKRKVINIVPSLMTPVCQVQARTFNEKAAALDNTAVLVVSADLPFAQKEFCTTNGIENVEALSLMRTKAFAKDYGMLITDGPLEGITARGVVVLDENDKVVHTELVKEVADEPNYDAALAALG